MEEGTFTGAGIDAFAPKPATEHVASSWTLPERPSRWRRLLVFIGVTDD